MLASVWNVLDFLACFPPLVELIILHGTSLPFRLGRIDLRWFKLLRRGCSVLCGVLHAQHCRMGLQRVAFQMQQRIPMALGYRVPKTEHSGCKGTDWGAVGCKKHQGEWQKAWSSDESAGVEEGTWLGLAVHCRCGAPWYSLESVNPWKSVFQCPWQASRALRVTLKGLC